MPANNPSVAGRGGGNDKTAGDYGAGSNVTVGNVTIHVNGGNTDKDTFQNIKDAIGSWFAQAVDATEGRTDAVGRQLGGAYGT